MHIQSVVVLSSHLLLSTLKVMSPKCCNLHICSKYANKKAASVSFKPIQQITRTEKPEIKTGLLVTDNMSMCKESQY
jgi:hypothetical protein